MAISYQSFSVGTAAVEIVPQSLDSKKVWIQNLSAEPGEATYSRAGYVYLIDQIISLSSGGTALFSFETGETGAQFEFWNFTSTTGNVLGQLIEAATITTTGTAVPAYNLNRNFADDYTATIETATALTGGTVVVQELVTADKAAGGSMESSKIVTLEPETEYGFKFVNQGNQTTSLHAQIGFVEKYNGINRVYLGTTAGSSVYLRGGESAHFDLRGDENIFAISENGTNQVAVMKAD
jgi:hypothetical protein